MMDDGQGALFRDRVRFVRFYLFTDSKKISVRTLRTWIRRSVNKLPKAVNRLFTDCTDYTDPIVL